RRLPSHQNLAGPGFKPGLFCGLVDRAYLGLKGAMIRYRLLEGWRFLAALLIMSFHFAHAAPSESLWVKDALESRRPLLVLSVLIPRYPLFAVFEAALADLPLYLRSLPRRLVLLYPLHLATLSYFVAVGLAVSFGLSRTGGNADLYRWDMLIPNLLL